MSIKDIPLPISQPAMTIPIPPELDAILQTNKGSIATDPQSGGILKVLSENGFKEKIQEGHRRGKTYTILHAAPSSDFTLIESWMDGTNPRKNYQFFKIVDAQPTVSKEIAHTEPTMKPAEIILQPKEILPPHENPISKPVQVSVPEPKQEIPVTVPIAPLESPVTKSPEKPLSSYDLLKQRFAQAGTFQPPLHLSTTQDTPQPPLKEFLDSIFGSAMNEWEMAKKIPARAFIYPTEYAWGTDAEGNQVTRSLENYPNNARKLREKIASAVENAASQGMTIETTSLEQVLTFIFDKGIM